jgi:hypothetical protein
LEGGHRIVGPLEIVDLHDPLGLVHDESAVHLVWRSKKCNSLKKLNGTNCFREMRIDPIEIPDDPKEP